MKISIIHKRECMKFVMQDNLTKIFSIAVLTILLILVHCICDTIKSHMILLKTSTQSVQRFGKNLDNQTFNTISIYCPCLLYPQICSIWGGLIPRHGLMPGHFRYMNCFIFNIPVVPRSVSYSSSSSLDISSTASESTATKPSLNSSKLTYK
jgi:hypothetical protein